MSWKHCIHCHSIQWYSWLYLDKPHLSLNTCWFLTCQQLHCDWFYRGTVMAMSPGTFSFLMKHFILTHASSATSKSHMYGRSMVEGSKKTVTNIFSLGLCNWMNCYMPTLSIVTELWGVWFPAGAGNFSLCCYIHTNSGAHPGSCQMSTGCKVAGAWSWPLTSI